MKKTIYSAESEILIAWLKQQRQLAGLTQRELARLLGVHHSIVGKIETGERRLDLIEFIAYCESLNSNPHPVIDLIKQCGDIRE